MDIQGKMYQAGVWAREHPKFTAVAVALVVGIIFGAMLR
jgi:ElaB/YqjD/DUF883 family membrane-anchored ribosome-binding protein